MCQDNKLGMLECDRHCISEENKDMIFDYLYFRQTIVHVSKNSL